MADAGRADVLVIGAGMAGASIASELSRDRRVVLLEMEEQAGYHTTGRSAAVFAEGYGNRIVRALTRASRPFLERPPAGFVDHALLVPRGWMFVGRTDQLALLADLERELGGALRPLDPALGTLVERVEIAGREARVAAVEIFQADGDRSVMTLATPKP